MVAEAWIVANDYNNVKRDQNFETTIETETYLIFKTETDAETKFLASKSVWS